jgi:predicted metal-binding protein
LVCLKLEEKSMAFDFDALIQDALALKADHAAIIEVSAIRFVEDFRKACEQNTCGKYNTNWVCPPAVGSFDELKARACQFKQGLLFQTVYQLAKTFDWKGMMAAKKICDGVFRGILDNVKHKHNLQDILALNAGSCAGCPRCAYLDKEKCRFPDQAFASVEAYGIDVINMEKACGIPYYNGKNTVSYVGLILFNIGPEYTKD